MTGQDPWLLPFLRMMSVRPGAYLGGSETVSTLELYLTAYSFARTDLGFPEFGMGEDALLKDFQDWLSKRLDLTSTLGWAGLIARIDPSPRNVHSFIRYFDEFLRSTGIGEGLGPHVAKPDGSP